MKRAMIMSTAEMGRVKNTKKLPLDPSRDCRKLCSIIGPRTRARIRGAASYRNFFNTYPMTPKIAMSAIYGDCC